MYSLMKLSLCAVFLFSPLVISTSPKHLNRRLSIDCKYCGPDALPRDYLWCSVDCGRPLGPGKRTKRSDAADCMQQCGPADVNCYKSCMGIPDMTSDTQACMENCDMLPTGQDYTHCTETCVSNTYLSAGADSTTEMAPTPYFTNTTTLDMTVSMTTAEATPITTEMTTQMTTDTATPRTTPITTPMSTVVWAMVPQIMTATINGTTQYITIQSMMMASNPMAGNKSATDCPTIVAEYSSTMTLKPSEASLANPGPTGPPLLSQAEKQMGASHSGAVLTAFAGLVLVFTFGLL